jgi:MoxR-like ATPase
MINDETEIQKSIRNSLSIKPKDFIVSDLKWKYLVRSVIRGKHVLITGPSRSGKTKAAISVTEALGRMDNFYYFNLGSTQDARSSLIGNTFYKKDEGTIFSPSRFYNAVTTENAVILLDEVSRAHPDALNILIPVLDSTQHYIRLEESEQQITKQIPKSVTIIGTMNEGSEYTATRKVDLAFLLRFPVVIETDLLTDEQELELVKIRYPEILKTNKNLCKQIIEIACHTRNQYRLDSSQITSFIPTGSVLEMIELVGDGFNLEEIAEVCIYPRYSDDNGIDDERTYMRQLVQKSIGGDNISNPIVDPVQ